MAERLQTTGWPTWTVMLVVIALIVVIGLLYVL